MEPEEDARAICVTVDGTRRIIENVSWEMTAGDIIKLLKPSRVVGPPHILVESWRGCLRRVADGEYVCKILEEWGEEARYVRLILTTSHSLPGLRLSRRDLNRSKIYSAQTHGKVAVNKRRCLSRIVTPKRGLGKEIARLVARAEVAKERLEEVEALHLKLEGANLYQYPSVGLSLLEEEEWLALQEQLAEEEEEEKQLEQRKSEISENIEAQNNELSAMLQQNKHLERKLLQEKEKWKSLQRGEESKELQVSQNEIETLRGELRIRQQQSHLQSKKIQEISAMIAALDQQQQDTV